MSFNWIEYLNLARRLAGTAENPADEAELRSAISRAYYAAFIRARNFLRDRDRLTIPTARTHQYVIAQFQNSPDSRRQKLGNRLEILRRYRNQADYEDAVPNLIDKSEEALTLSRRVISGLDSL